MNTVLRPNYRRARRNDWYERNRDLLERTGLGRNAANDLMEPVRIQARNAWLAAQA
jgi:hypothetical protein